MLSTLKRAVDAHSPRYGAPFLGAVAMGFAALVYVNALNNPFVFDDHRTILDNATIASLVNFRAIVLHDATRPLVNLSYAVDRALWGAGPFGFHLTSLLLHTANVGLLFLVAAEFGLPVALVAAALFAVHPMLTEAVGYVSGRSDVLFATFFLLAFLCARRWIRRGGAFWWWSTVGLWIAALLAKETPIMLPMVVVCYDLLIVDDGPDEQRRRMWRLHAPLIGVAFAAALVRFIVFWFLERRGVVRIALPAFLEQAIVVWRYVLLIVAPGGQTILHDVRRVEGLWDPLALVALVALAVVAAVALVGPLRLRRRAPMSTVGFGVAWFLLLLLPSAALSALDNVEPMAERRVYLAAAGLFLAAGALASWAWTLFRTSTLLRAACAVAFAVTLLSLSARAILRNIVWSDPVMLWREAADRAPGNWQPRTVLGESLHEAGRHEQAAAAYRQALALNPHEEMTYLKLAVCLSELGRTDEAAAAIQTLEKIDAGSPLVPIGRGAVALLSGDAEHARLQFEQALKEDPSNVMAMQWLAVLEERVDNPAAALARCEQVERAMPGSLSAEDCVRRNQQKVSGKSRE